MPSNQEDLVLYKNFINKHLWYNIDFYFRLLFKFIY